MNRNFQKLTCGLLVAVAFLVTLLFIVSIGFTAIWLHTYKVFTKEKLVAEIEVSSLKHESGQDYFDLTYKPVKEKTALETVFNRGEEETSNFEENQTFKLYGDEFEVGGQVIKFDNWATLLGFETIYKPTRIEGDYVDSDRARSNPNRSIHDLNGGTDEGWKYLEKNEDKMDFIVDTVYGSFATKFVQDESQSYGLYITEDGFILERLDTINR